MDPPRDPPRDPPGFIRPALGPALLVIACEIVVGVLLLLYLNNQRASLCRQLQFSRMSSNVTLREPFRRLALDAARAREASARRDDTGHPVQRRIDLRAAREYRRIASHVHDLPPLKC